MHYCSICLRIRAKFCSNSSAFYKIACLFNVCCSAVVSCMLFLMLLLLLLLYFIAYNWTLCSSWNKSGLNNQCQIANQLLPPMLPRHTVEQCHCHWFGRTRGMYERKTDKKKSKNEKERRGEGRKKSEYFHIHLHRFNL